MTNARKLVFGTLSLLIIAAGFMLSNFLASQKEQPSNVPSTKYVPTVHTISVLNQPMQIPVPVSGSVQALDEIELFSEVQGVATFGKIAFKTGNYFNKGDILLQIDDTEFRLGLQAQRSRLANQIVAMIPDLKLIDESWAPKWDAFLEKLNADQSLPAWPKLTDSREQRFVNARSLPESYFTIRSQEERLEKFVIKAPFNGLVTAANVSRGALVRNGQNLGRLTGTEEMEVMTAVSVSDIAYVKTGNEAILSSEQMNMKWTGKVIRVSNRIDPTSQMVDVFIRLETDPMLRDGLFLEGQIKASISEELFALPRNLLIEDRYVYGVNEGKLQRFEVKTIKFFQDQVLIQGLDNGTKLMREVVAGAYDGMPVNLVN